MGDDTDRDPVAPQPPADLYHAVVAEGRRRLRRRRLAALAVLAVVGGAGTTKLAATVLEGDGVDERVAAGSQAAPSRGSEWVEASDPVLGWHFEHPASWSLQRFAGQCRIGASGSVVTNLDRPLRFESLPDGCTTAWDLSGVPADFVGVQISLFSGGPHVPAGPDTLFPLRISQADLQAPPRDDDPPFRNIPVSLGGNGRYSVVVWEGRDASARDRERVERIVASIRPGVSRTDPLARPAIALGYVPERFGIDESMEFVRAVLGDRLLVMRWSGAGTGERSSFEIHRRVGNPLDVAAELRLQPGAEATQIHGRPGVVVRNTGSVAFSWLAADQVTLSVSSADLPADEVRRIADALDYRPHDDDLSPPAVALPSDPGDGNRQLTPPVVVLEGTVEGVRWELVAYQSDRGLCVDLRFGRGAGGVCGFEIGPERAVGVVEGQRLGGPRFVHGLARGDVVSIRVGLSDGSIMELPVASHAAFGVRFWAAPLPASIAVTGVVGRLADGSEVQAK
jgi:hypothetical protein